jgi:hypothetical protein
MCEHGAVATVIQCDNESVLVSLPMKGFPPGFQLRVGERVMVMLEGSEFVARPLVEMAIVNESTEDLRAKRVITINGQPHMLQAATAADKSAMPNQGSLIFIIDAGSAGGPRQIMAMRPR